MAVLVDVGNAALDVGIQRLPVNGVDSAHHSDWAAVGLAGLVDEGLAIGDGESTVSIVFVHIDEVGRVGPAEGDVVAGVLGKDAVIISSGRHLAAVDGNRAVFGKNAVLGSRGCHRATCNGDVAILGIDAISCCSHGRHVAVVDGDAAIV